MGSVGRQTEGWSREVQRVQRGTPPRCDGVGVTVMDAGDGVSEFCGKRDWQQ